jgi:hypothetical protein
VHTGHQAGGTAIPTGSEATRAQEVALTPRAGSLVEAAQPAEEIADLLLAANIDGVALGARRQPLEGRVDPLM